MGSLLSFCKANEPPNIQQHQRLQSKYNNIVVKYAQISAFVRKFILVDTAPGDIQALQIRPSWMSVGTERQYLVSLLQALQSHIVRENCPKC